MKCIVCCGFAGWRSAGEGARPTHFWIRDALSTCQAQEMREQVSAFSYQPSVRRLGVYDFQVSCRRQASAQDQLHKRNSALMPESSYAPLLGSCFPRLFGGATKAGGLLGEVASLIPQFLGLLRQVCGGLSHRGHRIIVRFGHVVTFRSNLDAGPRPTVSHSGTP